jgi:hypothetical protein
MMMALSVGSNNGSTCIVLNGADRVIRGAQAVEDGVDLGRAARLQGGDELFERF